MRRPTPTFGVRGVLSALQSVNQCESYSFDQDQLSKSKLMLRKGHRRRRELDEEIATASNGVVFLKLDDYLAKTDMTLLFVFHPTQLYSLRLRSTLAAFCRAHVDRLSCLALFGGDTECLTLEEKEDIQLFFQGTGFFTIRDKTSILNLLSITQVPSLVVIPHNSGRPIMGQELAFDWNAVDPSSEESEVLLQRWASGHSGLSFSQTVFAKTIGDSSSVCILM